MGLAIFCKGTFGVTFSGDTFEWHRMQAALLLLFFYRNGLRMPKKSSLCILVYLILSLCSYIHLFIHLSVHLSICPSHHSSAYPSIIIHPPTHPRTYSSVHLNVPPVYYTFAGPQRGRVVDSPFSLSLSRLYLDSSL